MATVAEEYCATCHHLRPMTEMREVRVKRVVGRSVGSSHSSSSRSGHWNSFGGGRSRSGNSSGGSSRSGSSSRTDLAVYRTWVCKGCPAPSSDWDPGTLKLIGSGIILAAVFGLSMAGDKKPRPLPSADASPSAALPDRSTEIGLPEGEAAPVDGLDAQSMTDADKVSEPLAVEAAAPSATHPLILNYDIDVVRQAVSDALESGAPARWELDQWKGYAVPSEISESAGGRCRNVSVTFEDKAKQAHELPTATFCDRGSGWSRTTP